MSDWDDWRFALAVSRANSAAEAAGELGVDASTVQRRIRNLEGRLGVRLFDRLGGVYLTDAGLDLIRAAGRMEAEVLGIERHRGIGRGPTGSLRITTSEDLAESLLGPHFVDFRRSYPRIELNLIIGASQPRQLRGGCSCSGRSATQSGR